MIPVMKFFLTVLVVDLLSGQHYMYEGYYPTYTECDKVRTEINEIFDKQREVRVLINSCDQVV